MPDVQDYECPLCHEILFQPCVPPCGHAFCKSCLRQLIHHAYTKRMDYSRAPETGAKCPVCRRVLHVTRTSDLAVCGHLDRLLASSFPVEYAARQEGILEGDDTCDDESTRGLSLPIFVLDSMLPGQHMHLNVFEPRYVGMVRRALQGSRCFGMVGAARSGHMAINGVEVKLVSAAEQWDGRFLVEIVGLRPFKVIRSMVDPDGLLQADVEFTTLEGGDSDDTQAAHDAAVELPPLVEQWEAAVRAGSWERRPGQLALVREQLGPAPPSSQPGALAAWIVALINPLPALGVAPEMRPALLTASNPLERVRVAREGLEASLKYLQAAENSWVIRGWRLVPKPLRPHLPAVALLMVALAIARAVPLW